MKRKVFNPLAFKDTEWNKRRVDRGFKLREIASYLHTGVGRVGAFFTGQQMPPDDIIESLCDYFDVDFLAGKHEFEEAHKHWDAEHERVLRIPAKRMEKPVKIPKKRGRKPKVVVDPVAVVPTVVTPAPAQETPKVDSILAKLYGKVDYDTYTAVANNCDNAAEILYGKVDYQLYTAVVNK